MNIPCPNANDCVCEEPPYQSSEYPDLLRYIRQHWASRECRHLEISYISQAEADRLARYHAELCLNPNLVGNDEQTAMVNCYPSTPGFTCNIPSPLKCCTGPFETAVYDITGGQEPFVWTFDGEELPAGFVRELSADGRSMILSGTVTAAGNRTIQIQIVDGSGFTLDIPWTIQVVGITDTTLPTPKMGVNYSHQLSATGGSGLYVYSLASGTLPDGLSLSSTGLITGKSQRVGPHSFTIGVASL